MILTEEELPNLQALCQKQINDWILMRFEGDPMVRELVRPPVPWVRVLLLPLGMFLVMLACCVLMSNSVSTPICVAAAFFSFVLYVCLHLRPIIICMVKLYQHFAPDKVRLRCKCKPSCSEYMLMAVQKYGPYKGGWKGVHRIRKCGVEIIGKDDP